MCLAMSMRREAAGGVAVTMVLRGALWIGVFLAVTLSPLVFAVIGMAGAGRGFWTEFSAALGFVGLSLLGLEFGLVHGCARLPPHSGPMRLSSLARFYDPATPSMCGTRCTRSWQSLWSSPRWRTPTSSASNSIRRGKKPCGW